MRQESNGKMIGGEKVICSYHEHARDKETIEACSGLK